MSHRTLSVQPLTREAYAPFGDLIEVPPPDHPGRLVNQGFVRRFDRAAELRNLRPHAQPNFALFRCQPRPREGFVVTNFERHPDSTQLFLPIGPAHYLAVVALGGDRPDLSTTMAFIARSPLGISYHPGVWHLPLVAFDQVTDFACVVFEDETARDCDVAMLAEHEHMLVVG